MAWVGLYALSWFWSDNPEYWNTRLQVKLPIILLPLAFAFTPAFSYRQLKIFTLVLIMLLLFAAGYSLYHFLLAPDVFIEAYNVSHVIPSIPKNDHIRSSLAIACGVVWLAYFAGRSREGWLKWLSIATIIILTFHLHLLAARTGLMALYIFFLGWLLYKVSRLRSRLVGALLLIAFLGSAVAATQLVPTLRERIDYVRYTIRVYNNEGLKGNYSDLGRIMSYDLAFRLIKSHPVTGVGAGHILDSMKGAYSNWYPHVAEEQRLIPHNQFLTVGVATGIPGLILFTLWVIYPIRHLKRNRTGFFFLMIWCMMLVPLSVEPVLEVQFGVFVYLFFLLWMRHAMLKPSEAQCTS